MRTSLLITLVPILVLFAACAGKGAKCGDGVQDSGELCDDGNKVNGDGCSSVCRIEGWCGNAVCEEGEAHTCPTDCPICGNGQCDDTESVASCTVDCYCTNGTCDEGESTAICPQDCPAVAVCGDGFCELDESISTCLADCYCTNGTCDPGETETTCPQDCGANPCGDGTCTPAESLTSCPADCYCTNGTCDSGENATICPQDCTTPPTCGNGQLDGQEPCDGNNLGGRTCLSQGFDGGTLTCNTNCTLNTAGCTSSTGCTIVPQSGCPNGQKCTVDTASANRCNTAGVLGDGEPCGVDADCAAGLGCAALPGTSGGICRRFCRGSYYDTSDCNDGPGSVCFYSVADGFGVTLSGLFQCTVHCDLVTGSGCGAGMTCTLLLLDRDGDQYKETDSTECFSNSDPYIFCGGSSPCPTGSMCYEGSCYRWCSSANTAVCTSMGLLCNSFDPQLFIGAVEYGLCL